jgi:hypothetical protein
MAWMKESLSPANLDAERSAELPSTSPSQTAPSLPRISLRRALVFPFTQRNWPLALAYIGAIQFVPILGFLVIRGWRFEIAKRVGENHAQSLPDWRHAYEHLKQGTLLFFVTQFYFLPMYIALAWPRSGILWSVIGLLRGVYERLFTDLAPQPWSEVLLPGLRSLVIFVLILFLVPPLLSPLVESATQRYAHTGRVRTLFEVWQNFRFAFSDLYDVIRIELCILGLNLVVLIVSLILILTVGGAAFIPPVMIPVYMWTRGALMGQWIWKNRLEEQTHG